MTENPESYEAVLSSLIRDCLEARERCLEAALASMENAKAYEKDAAEYRARLEGYYQGLNRFGESVEGTENP